MQKGYRESTRTEGGWPLLLLPAREGGHCSKNIAAHIQSRRYVGRCRARDTK